MQLVLGAVREVIEALGPADRFRLVASDVDTRALGAMADRSAEEGAIAALSALEPEGATDIGAMLHAVAGLANETEKTRATSVVYVGDGSATWGETRADALAQIAKRELGVPLHVMLLGDRADADTMQAIAASTGAMINHPRTQTDAEVFARRIATAPTRRRIAGAHIVSSEGDVYPAREQTLYEGDDLVAVVRAATGARLTLVGDGVSIPIVDAPHPARLVAERWAKARIGSLEAMPGNHKDEIVKLSLDSGVLSKHTSLLVLESDEAYARFDIVRRAASRDRAPTVTGNSLDSASSHLASLDPDRLQPGNPEVPSSTRQRTQGHRGAAVRRGEGGLVQSRGPRMDRALPRRPGHARRDVRGPRDHRPGRRDDRRATLALRGRHAAPGRRRHDAPRAGPSRDVEDPGDPGRQRARIAAAIPAARRTGTLDEQRARFAKELRDARRVDVRLPDGTVMSLVPIALGEFRGFWTPSSALSGPITLHVVAFDRARNQSEDDVLVNGARP